MFQFQGWWSILYLNKVYPLEHRMSIYFVEIPGPYSLVRVHHEDLPDQVLSYWGDVRGHFVIDVLDVLECVILSLALKGQSIGKQLEQHHPECPDITRKRILLALQHLWGDIIRSSDEGVILLLGTGGLDVLLGET